MGTTAGEISGLALIAYLYTARRGHGEAAQPIPCGRWNGGVPFRSEQKFNSEPRQCWGKADREGSGGLAVRPSFGGSDYNKNITHMLERPSRMIGHMWIIIGIFRKHIASDSIFKMPILLFLLDTSASMNQRTYLGTTYLDIAKGAVEIFMKVKD